MSLLRPLILITIVLSISAGGYIWSTQKNLLPTTIQAYSPQLSDTVSNLVSTAQDKIAWIKEHQLQPFGQRLEQSRLFSVDSQANQPIHQRAFDYARYEYCKQVVRDWENQTGEEEPTE